MAEVLLLSGGIDSIAIAAWRHPSHCLTLDYGQRPARGEIAAASEVHFPSQKGPMRLGTRSLCRLSAEGNSTLLHTNHPPQSRQRSFWAHINDALTASKLEHYCLVRKATVQTIQELCNVVSGHRTGNLTVEEGFHGLAGRNYLQDAPNLHSRYDWTLR